MGSRGVTDFSLQSEEDVGNLVRLLQEPDGMVLFLKIWNFNRLEDQDAINLTATLRRFYQDELYLRGTLRVSDERHGSLMKCLRENLMDLDWGSTSVDTDDLADFIAHHKNLRDLVFRETEFLKRRSRWPVRPSLAETLRSHPALGSVAFDRCRIDEETVSPEDRIAVLEAFSTMPQLEVLKVGCWIPEGLAANQLARSLQLPPNLTKLNIRSLHPDAQSREAFCGYLTQLLQTNSTLRILEVHFQFLEEEATLIEMMGALQTNRNSSIEELSFTSGPLHENLSHRFVEALASLVESNMNIIKLQGDWGIHGNGEQAEPKAKLDVYRKANQLGRKALAGGNDGADKLCYEEWIAILANARHADVPVLFCLLSMRPDKFNWKVIKLEKEVSVHAVLRKVRLVREYKKIDKELSLPDSTTGGRAMELLNGLRRIETDSERLQAEVLGIDEWQLQGAEVLLEISCLADIRWDDMALISVDIIADRFFDAVYNVLTNRSRFERDSVLGFLRCDFREDLFFEWPW